MLFFSDVIQRSVLIEGVLFRARYLGSTQLVCEGQPTKTTRMMQAEEAVSRIKVMHDFFFQYFFTLYRIICAFFSTKKKRPTTHNLLNQIEL